MQRSLPSFSAEYFAFFDFSDFESIVRALEQDPEISHAVFYNSTMEALTQEKDKNEDLSPMLVVTRDIKDADGNLLGYLKIVFKRDNLIKSKRNNLILVTLSLIVALLLISVGMFILVRKLIAKPMGKTMQMIQEMEKGHLNTRLQMNQEDEIGRMARTMDAFSESLQHEVVGFLQKIADGDLTFEVTPKDEYDEVRNALKKTGEDLNAILEQIDVAADQMASGAGQVTDASQSLSLGATEQATSLEEISSSMMQMASQTRTNAENANEAAAAQELSAQAAQLQEMLDRFTLKKKSKRGLPPDSSQWQIPQLPLEQEDFYQENDSIPDKEDEQVDYKQIINLDDSEFGKY